MKTTAILKKALIKILRKSPATLDLVTEVVITLIIERAKDRFDKLIADETGEQMKEMLLNQHP